MLNQDVPTSSLTSGCKSHNNNPVMTVDTNAYYSMFNNNKIHVLAKIMPTQNNGTNNNTMYYIYIITTTTNHRVKTS